LLIGSWIVEVVMMGWLLYATLKTRPHPEIDYKFDPKFCCIKQWSRS
jgi:hypothetical protein